jgi:hypothetical protein
MVEEQEIDYDVYGENPNEDDDIDVIQKLKGVKKLEVKKLVIDQYRDCIYDAIVQTATQLTFRSYNHQVTMIEQTKISLTPSDNKRYISDDHITTYAYGHYMIDRVNKFVPM